VNAIVAAGAAGFLARYEAAKGRLPGDSTLRAAAAEAFRTLGLPGTTRGRRSEAWKYTSLQPLAGLSFEHDDWASRPQPWNGVNQCLNFRAGRFLRYLSSPLPGFASFAEQPDFGELSWPDRDPMVALHTLLAEDGVVLTVPPGVDLGIVYLSHHGIDGTSAHPRHMIRLGAGARLTLIDLSVSWSNSLHNPVTEVHVADGAVLTHVRVQHESVNAFHLATIYAAVAAGGTYDSFTLNLGARISRTEIHARLDGPGAVAHLNAAQLLKGSQHADFTTVVHHAAPKGTSRQTVKSVLDGSARCVFQGRIEVARGAQGTDGYQMHRALLLSPDAEIDTKPELEIFADDVKCSHGATVGELDAEQLFYLRSRGIPDQEARTILVRAFLAEALDPVTDGAARDFLERHVALWHEGKAA
jgi:Fe-S cluster assembly protein SufD